MIEDNRPIFQLTVSELGVVLKKIIEANTQSVECQRMPEIERKRVDGIRGLAGYLKVSLPTAQRLKNKGKIPFYESGNKVYFFTDEIDQGLKKGGK